MMNILCYGAGAIGAYIGGSLALRGHRVVFLDRPPVVAALRDSGIHLNLDGAERAISEPELVDSLPAALASVKFDLALFALKSYVTSDALETLRPHRDELPPLVCLQNGVENEGLLASELGAERIIPATVTSAIGRRGSGSVVLERLRGVGVAAGHPLSADLAAAMSDAGLKARLYPNAPAMKWSKLLTNLLCNASSAILDLTPAEIMGDPRLYAVEIAQLRETLHVMKALGLKVVDLPGTPVRLLAFGARLPLRLSRPLLSRGAGRGRGSKMPSFHIDLRQVRGRSEVDYLNGAVVRFGERTGVPTPVNRFLNTTLLALSEGRISLENYTKRPDIFISELTRS